MLDDPTKGTDEEIGVGVISETEKYELVDTVPEVPEAGRLLPGAPGPLEARLEGAGPEEVGGRIPELIDMLDGGTSLELADPLGARCELPENAVTGRARVELNGPEPDEVGVGVTVVSLQVVYIEVVDE